MEEKRRKELLSKWGGKKEETFKRDVEGKAEPFLDSRNAVFLYGPRRSGKSTVAMRLLLKQEKGKRAYVNLEDPALEGELGAALLDDFAKGLSEKDLLVLDEVQLVPGWEKWVRRAVDTRQCRVMVTGSSAKLLSSEFATSLGGRGIGFQVLPLSFREYCRVREKPELEGYLEEGGYPEVVLQPEKKDKLLEAYFEFTLLKDVVSRHKVRNSPELRTLALYLLTNSGKLTSLRQLTAMLGLSHETAHNFIEYLEAAFLVFQAPFFSYSMKESLAMPRKVYAWDNGMQSYASKSVSPDLGSKAETAVAIELRRRGFELYYWKGRREIDFVARKKLEILAISVTYAAKPPEREMEGLVEFCKEKKLKTATLLYLGKKATEERDGIIIEKLNLREWLLEKQN